MKREELEKLTNDELIEIVLKLQEDIVLKDRLCDYYYKEKNDLNKAIDAICFISNKAKK